MYTMHCAQKLTDNIYWIGSNDWDTERFENLFPIPLGVSYNSYFIDDEKLVSSIPLTTAFVKSSLTM